MSYLHAVLLLDEAGREINERNLTDVLEQAGISVEESRVKALIAALEDVDLEESHGPSPTADHDQDGSESEDGAGGGEDTEPDRHGTLASDGGPEEGE